MTYAALPDRRMPYDIDGTVVYVGYMSGGAIYPQAGSVLAEWNDNDFQPAGTGIDGATRSTTWWFFPERREVTAYYVMWSQSNPYDTIGGVTGTVEGSNDTTNGLDGTWETASLPAGAPTYVNNFSWRSSIKAISFTGGKQTIRMNVGSYDYHWVFEIAIAHIYGQKTSGQTPDDILFLDPANADAEFQAPIDFGDRPLGTTATRQFKVKNGSATKTANTINLQCNDPDFVISTDNTTWVVTINISSLAAGAKSNVMYVRNTSPAIGAALAPRFARIVATVASYT